MKKQLTERFQELAGIKSLSEVEAFGAAGTDKRTGQVIGDILQLIKPEGIDLEEVILELIKSTGIDPEKVIEAIKKSDNFKNYGLPKMDPDNWGFNS